MVKFKMTSQNAPKKITLKFDITMLNSLIGFIFTQNRQVTKKALNNMKKLFDVIDERAYDGNEKLESRLYFINRALKARLVEKMENESIIINYCRGDIDSKEIEQIITDLPIYKKINFNEINYINNAIQERLKYFYIFHYKDIIYETLERIDAGEYESFKTINEEFLDIVRQLINETRKSSILDETDTLDLSSPDIEDQLNDIAANLLDPSRMLRMGIKRLNGILGGGYFSKRLYMYMGLPAGFKSGILLKTAVDIKKYNKDMPSRKPGKRRTILLITMENSVQESVERLFNMTITAENIRNFNVNQIVEMLKTKGELILNDDEDISIVIKYYPNRSISTADVYTIMEDLEDNGAEIIAFILDYIKRIRPSEHGRDEKEELKNVTNELKTIAEEKDIPVISAHQLNRTAASTVDAGMGSSKEDLARHLGNSNVGTALIIRAA